MKKTHTHTHTYIDIHIDSTMNANGWKEEGM